MHHANGLPSGDVGPLADQPQSSHTYRPMVPTRPILLKEEAMLAAALHVSNETLVAVLVCLAIVALVIWIVKALR